MRGPEETWATGDRVARLETLTVLPGHRGHRGQAASAACSSTASNAEAVRFYERLVLTRFLVMYAGAVPE